MFSRSYLLGLVFILAVSIIWACSGAAMQYINHGLNFKSPLLLTYIMSSLLTLYLPMWQLWFLLNPSLTEKEVIEDAAAESLLKPELSASIDAETSTAPIMRATSVTMVAATALVTTNTISDRKKLKKGAVNNYLRDMLSIDHSESDIDDDYSDNGSHQLVEDSGSHDTIHSTDHIGTLHHRNNMSRTHSALPSHDEEVDKDHSREHGKHAASFTHYDVIKMAAVISPVYFLANLWYNTSLYMTSITSTIIISNLSGSFALTFSYLMGVEDVTNGKILGIIICFLGAVCVALKDNGDPVVADVPLVSGQNDSVIIPPVGDDDHVSVVSEQGMWGDVIALLSAMGYGLYTVILRLMVPDEDTVPMQLLLGYVGLLQAVVLGPILIFLYAEHMGKEFPMTLMILGFITFTGFGNNVIADYLWARSVVLTSPTVATIGLSITIPLAMITDFVMWGLVPTHLLSLGALLVTLGFVLVNVSTEQEAAVFEWLQSNSLTLRGKHQHGSEEDLQRCSIGTRSGNNKDLELSVKH